MSSTTTLRSDTARTGTNPNFSINTNPWRKYLSIDLGTTVTFFRPIVIDFQPRVPPWA